MSHFEKVMDVHDINVLIRQKKIDAGSLTREMEGINPRVSSYKIRKEKRERIFKEIGALEQKRDAISRLEAPKKVDVILRAYGTMTRSKEVLAVKRERVI